jgi:hypothetical protein
VKAEDETFAKLLADIGKIVAHDDERRRAA